MGVGVPAQWWLQEFGEVCYAYWGEVAYHVGSSLDQKDGWRDVDVRLMLDDDAFAREFPGVDPARTHASTKWVACTLAWSALGKQMTGLPVDCQVQQRTHANTHDRGHRSALLRHHNHHIFGSAVPLDRDFLVDVLLDLRQAAVRTGVPADAAMVGHAGRSFSLREIDTQLALLRGPTGT